MTQGAPTSTASVGPAFRTLLAFWFGWALLLLAYQALAPMRLPVQRPDNATSFSAQETAVVGQPDRPYLGRTGLLGSHVAWDSEYYLSIALHGYDDPQMQAVSPASVPAAPRSGPQAEHPTWTSKNYAYFPAYPVAMRVVAAPLRFAGLAPISAATLAGVAISLLGALGAALAIADLTAADAPGERIRAGIYLMIWPAAAFLAQVYTEGLFVGLSFGALALLRRRRWVWAALLAVLATWTRANGALLLIPFAWTWLADGGLRRLTEPLNRRNAAITLILGAAPALAYIAWRVVLGERFEYVEGHFFGRGMLQVAASYRSALQAMDLLQHGAPQAVVYYAAEAVALLAALLCSVVLWRRDKPLALYGLAILSVALTSGAEMGFPRYVLAVPALFLVPARWGRSATFDRLWSLGGILGLAVWTLAFAVGFWDG